MESEEDSNASSVSYDGSSDFDITKYVLPTMSPGEGSSSVNKSQVPEAKGKLDEELTEKAYQFISGSLSFNEYEAIIEEKHNFNVVRYIPPTITALIGQANVAFAKRDYDETLRLCKEAIRFAPDFPEPYRTLSELYEEYGDEERSLQLGMVAETLGSKDAQRWAALAQKAMALNKLDAAVLCYSKAAKFDPTMIEAHLMKIDLYDKLGERKNMLLSYRKLVADIPAQIGAPVLEYAKSCAQLLHEDGDVAGALSVMEIAFAKAPSFVEMDDVNLIVELYITLQQFEQALEVISKHCDVEIEAENDLVANADSDELTLSSLRVLSCTIKAEIPFQIRAKLVILLINLKSFNLAETVAAPLLEVVEEYGDLLVDISEAFMMANKHSNALALLKLLVESKTMSAPQVWLHYADCLRVLNRKEEAVSAYLVVMDRAPHLAEARLVVSELLNDLGRGEEALSALTQDPASGYLDISLLFERQEEVLSEESSCKIKRKTYLRSLGYLHMLMLGCLLLKDNPAKRDEFLAVGRLLLSRHCTRIRNRKELNTFTRFSGCGRRQEALRKMREDESDEEEPMYVEGKRMPNADEDWMIFRSLCQAAFDSKQFSLLQRLTFSALGSKVLCRIPEREKQIYTLATLSCFFNRDTHYGHSFLRQLLFNDSDNVRAWNMFNLVATFSEETRQQKFVIRLLTRKPSHPAIPLIFANNCFMSGSYKQAVSEYLLLFKHEPSPLLALMIASTFIQLSSQKQSASTNALVAQAMGFIAQYRSMRKEALQEVHYNLGRLNHHLGLLPVALYHYKQALETPPTCELFDLKREAAYNIAIIYQSAKSFDLARYYLTKYITV